MTAALRAGDWVEVLDAAAIVRSLDADGAAGRMPFMPEMLQFCGRRFRISKVAHKTCDTAFKTGARALDDCYHLEDLRCDGSAHGGCQATCLLFFKGAWLRRVDGPHAGAAPAPAAGAAVEEARARLMPSTRAAAPAGAPVRYSCQTTRLFDASRPLAWWNPLQYLRDLRSGNIGFGEFARYLALSWLRALTRIKVGYRLTRALYDRAHRMLVGGAAPACEGTWPDGTPTPAVRLDLRPGEIVFVKPIDEVRKTLNSKNRNRGLWFDEEYVPFCGTQRRVSHRVDRILDERTGEMLEMKNPCIVLEGVKCDAHYSLGRMFCPRGITAYWREAWLERPASASADQRERAE